MKFIFIELMVFFYRIHINFGIEYNGTKWVWNGWLTWSESSCVILLSLFVLCTDISDGPKAPIESGPFPPNPTNALNPKPPPRIWCVGSSSSSSSEPEPNSGSKLQNNNSRRKKNEKKLCWNRFWHHENSLKVKCLIQLTVSNQITFFSLLLNSSKSTSRSAYVSAHINGILSKIESEKQLFPRHSTLLWIKCVPYLLR